MSEDVVNSVNDVGNEKQDSNSNGKKITDSLVKMISNDELDTELPCLDKKLLLFPNRKLAIALNSDEGELTVESTESTLIQDSKEELAKEFLSPG